MAIKLTSTKDAAINQGVKILVHGPSGSGKTMLCATLPAPTIIISAEAGLLSLRHIDIPVLEVKSVQDVRDAYQYLLSDEGLQYQAVALDSITEIAEVCLSHEKAQSSDPRQAYGALIEHMTSVIKSFRDLPGRHVYMSCKQEHEKDESTGAMLFSPSMPGSKLGPQLPYLFDEVFALRVEKDDDGNLVRWLQTFKDYKYDAKDRSGCLEQFEPPNLANVIAKITQPVNNAANAA